MSMYGSDGSPGGFVPPPKIRFDVIGDAWRLFQQQMGPWILASLIVFGIAMVIFGVFYALMMGTMLAALKHDSSPSGSALAGMYLTEMGAGIVIGIIAAVFNGGLYRMALKQLRGETIAPGDVFGAMDVAGPLIVLALLTQLAVNVGSMFCVVPGLILGGLFMFAPLLVVDRKMGAIEAIQASITVLKADLLNTAIFYFVIALVAGLGSFLCGVGVIFTLPLMPLGLALLYRDFFTGGAPPPGYPGDPGMGPQNPWTPQPPGQEYTPPPGSER